MSTATQFEEFATAPLPIDDPSVGESATDNPTDSASDLVESSRSETPTKESQERGMFESFWILLGAICVLFSAATALGFGAKFWHGFEYICHFRPQYLVALSLVAIVAAVGFKFKLAGFAAVFALVNFALIIPYYVPKPKPIEAGPELRLVSLNVLSSNRGFDRVNEYLRQSDADVITLVEVDRNWAKSFRTLSDCYPHMASAGTQTFNGVVILSKHQIANTRTETVLGRKVLIGDIIVDGRTVHVVAAHTHPPRSRMMIERRNNQLAEIAEIVRPHDNPTVLAGDLNISSWSPSFRSMLKASGLRDSRIGHGIQPTWPSDNFLFQIPIDHCLVSSTISVVDREVGANVGSDHFPIIVDMVIDGRESSRN